jgi:hypothetical protein
MIEQPRMRDVADHLAARPNVSARAFGAPKIHGCRQETGSRSDAGSIHSVRLALTSGNAASRSSVKLRCRCATPTGFSPLFNRM